MNMEKEEFLKALWSGDFDLLYEFSDVINLEEGFNMYYICKKCDYKTRHVSTFDYMGKIDSAIADHLWENHRSEVVKATLVYEGKKIAAAEGQKNLDNFQEVKA